MMMLIIGNFYKISMMFLTACQKKLAALFNMTSSNWSTIIESSLVGKFASSGYSNSKCREEGTYLRKKAALGMCMRFRTKPEETLALLGPDSGRRPQQKTPQQRPPSNCIFSTAYNAVEVAGPRLVTARVSDAAWTHPVRPWAWVRRECADNAPVPRAVGSSLVIFGE